MTVKQALPGRIVLPGDERWNAARQAWNLNADQRPAAVAFPASAEEVAVVVVAARDHGLRVAAQTTGHAAAALGDLQDTVLLKTADLSGVQIDADARRCHAGAGALSIEVAAPASEHGLAALRGSSPDVGLAGYVLGGGVGWLARKHGLAAGTLRSAQVVTAEGAIVHTADDPELLWALRGGGGSFGVVTALELALVRPPALYAGALLWPWERSADVLHTWNAWQATASEEITTAARILQLPDRPELPDAVRGRAFVAIDGAALADGAELLAPLRALGPELDTFAPVAPVALSRLHMDPEQPVPAVTDHRLLGELPAQAIDALVAAAGPGSGSRLITVELRQLGGAVGRPAPGGGALTSIDAPVALVAGGVAEDPALLLDDLARVTRALAPWDVGRRYMNFAERGADVATLFDPETYRRLRRVKARLDPDDRFRSNHPIAPGQGEASALERSSAGDRDAPVPVRGP